MAQLLAPQSMETLDTWGSMDALDAFGSLEALDNIELFETTASVSIAWTQSTVAGEILFAVGAASVAVTATGSANKLFDVNNALNTTFNVKVVSSGGNKYEVNGVVAPQLTMIRGTTYTFNVSDSSNNNHPLRFKNSYGSSYSSGVTVNGTEGQANATVVFAVPSDAPSSLRYYCTVHGEAMGNTISVTDDVAAANIGLSVTAASFERIRTVASALTVAMSATGGGVFNQIGATGSVTISIAKSASIEAIEHVVASVTAVITASGSITHIQHDEAAEAVLVIASTGLPNFTAVLAASETIATAASGDFFVTSAFNSTQEISISSTITGEILGERWIPITTSTNNVWHLR